jgi:hypothetical protein
MSRKTAFRQWREFQLMSLLGWGRIRASSSLTPTMSSGKKPFNLSLSPATASAARETVLGQLSKQSKTAYETKSQN